MTRHRFVAALTVSTAFAAGLSGCSTIDGLLFGTPPSAPTSTDARFAEFDEPTAHRLDIDVLDTAQSADLNELMKERLPGLPFEEIKYMGANRDDPRDPMAEIGRTYWLHAVITTDSRTIDKLLEIDEKPAARLPGIHPDLQKFVPQHCTFTGLDAWRASDELAPGVDGPVFGIEEIAVSKDCQMVVLRGTGE